MKNALLVILFLVSIVSVAAEQASPINQTDFVADTTLQQGSIIAYYNRDWQQVPAHKKAFYYRKLIAIDDKQGYWIQDFYSDTHTKQTDPILVVNKADILHGHIKPNKGEVVVWFKDGLKKEQSYYQNGQIQSIIRWHRNGQKGLEGYFQQGERNGVWTGWYENGNKRWQGGFDNGKRQGLWTVWKVNGVKEREMQFQQDEKIAQWSSFDEE
ncbi:toxin-antitoxin system YwqK family antitoxin [Entomomonas asaccharolytica]|uniref:Toxin-antitoxin system YwqK family antitoxin n=1 Tax=Entomomonas asaccharolytica TaxID=2785331 RepID=A0A974RW19_9GAMM|nr:hypothetical protein [Entomomonas asaccharolytica]QQP84723.1 hypothetical protein JHT90_09920 [Entomomonas asaccharolytica]